MATEKIDPRIYIPPVEGYEYEEATPISADSGDVGEDIVITVPIDVGLQPPEQITIVDQIVRKGADGRTVVDLVIEVQDMPGATEYEVRTATI